MKSISKSWNNFWYAPGYSANLALIRVSVGILGLLSAAILVPDIEAFYSDTWLGSQWATVIVGVLLVSAIGVIAGILYQISSSIMAITLLVLAHFNPIIFNSGDTLLRYFAFILAVSPAGSATLFSASPTRSFLWPLRLIQIQIVLMYGAAVFHKLTGVSWRDGTAAAYPLRIDDVTRFPVFAEIASNPTFAIAATWGTLVIESLFAICIWNRRLFWFVFSLGVGLHLSIEITLRAGLFSWVVITGYLAFIPPHLLSRTLRRCSGRFDLEEYMLR